MVRLVYAIATPILVVCSLIGGCFAVQHYTAPMIFTRADGTPNDWAGDPVQCPHCLDAGQDGWGKNFDTDLHKYRCSRCQKTYFAWRELGSTLEYWSSGEME